MYIINGGDDINLLIMTMSIVSLTIFVCVIIFVIWITYSTIKSLTRKKDDQNKK